MVDFFMISTRSTKRGVIEIYPRFLVKKTHDLMIRGGDFYAIWIEERGLWSTDEHDALQLIDRELKNYANNNAATFDAEIRVLYMWDAASGMIDTWHKYCQRQMRDSFHSLDEKLVFANTQTKKDDYASKRLCYPLERGDTASFSKLISVLYAKEEREKIVWSIGAIVSGESKKLQKFMVLYGSAGTGKSTILNIIQQLFNGYYSVFDAKALGSSSNSFALESFKNNPLVAIQHDGDLSRIEDNTRLNSLVSHEMMTVNEKFKSTYANQFKCFLFMGTNKPVKITDAKSGLIRRLIDVSPTGDKLSPADYRHLVTQIGFELGAIAYECMEFYMNNPDKYDSYIPVTMMGASNDFYNFVVDSHYIFKSENATTLKAAWEMYKNYCEYAKVPFPFSQRIFKEELRNYFEDYEERHMQKDGTRVRNYYSGFCLDKFEQTETMPDTITDWLVLNEQESIFDTTCLSCLAQYATSNDTPYKKWNRVTSTLAELDTSRTHYVKVPENHIVIDFDIVDEYGKKNLALNLVEANKFPKTYAEISKGGQGLHLHYIYTGDVTKLSKIYSEHIEVKVHTGGSALRRKLSKCTAFPIATLQSGLPLKGSDKMMNPTAVQSEKGLRILITRNLQKEIHPGTKPSIDFIDKILNDAQASGLHYDVSDMKNNVLAFAANSSNQAEYCIKMVNKMKFQSLEPSKVEESPTTKLVFYDIEVFPNLFLVNWKMEGDKPIVRMINPSPVEIEELLRYRLVGFNCRRYDNHILYARFMGYTVEQLYKLSQKIISGNRECFFGEAYNLSYTDIYDFASAGNKKSLKKLEIEMGIHHQELGLPWDEPVDESLWGKVADYCDNDVIATEAAFHYLSADWTARQILADLAGMSVNDTTNSLTTKIIFDRNRKPQNAFCYRNLAEPVMSLKEDVHAFLKRASPHMMSQTHGTANSLLPYFPDYKYEYGKSIYRDEVVGEGGYVYANPGIYENVALLDIVSMHPTSVINECLFGVDFTTRFKEIVDGRVSIKHEAWDIVDSLLDGKLKKYVKKVQDGEITSKQLADALKTAINSVYGLTSANFENPFRDVRNKDNIVAKRGALFMINLKHEVQERGFVVAHIKTDSIKIPNASPEIIAFVTEYGKLYGYDFEHEATYKKMCLVNDAVYIAQYKDGKKAGKWTATGTQFQVPYVFKRLFSKEDILFSDMCETKTVSQGSLFIDMNEQLSDGEHNYKFVGKVGQFCPMVDGSGGGVLYRKKDDKYYAVTGTKGFRWLESEMVKELGKEHNIEQRYYEQMVDKAVATISKYGDFDRFIQEDTMDNEEEQ